MPPLRALPVDDQLADQHLNEQARIAALLTLRGLELDRFEDLFDAQRHPSWLDVTDQDATRPSVLLLVPGWRFPREDLVEVASVGGHQHYAHLVGDRGKLLIGRAWTDVLRARYLTPLALEDLRD